METVTIALPPGVSEFVKHQVAARGYDSVSDYVQELIRADEQQAAKSTLEADVLAGLNSGESAPMTDENWRSIREEVVRRAQSRAAD